ncbi:hypothetical protein [Fusibacter sp. JL216-2]|uniref:restriction endonuclease-related protein n=1 Tax=Fusibacter sp. JL216-2 TaxID=3071453 RepID=UPI003D32CD9C
MTGDKHELLIKLLAVLIEWKGNIKVLPDEADAVFNRFSSYLLHNTKVTPPKNLRDVVLCLKYHSVESLGFYLNEDLKDNYIINENGGLDEEIERWYESTLLKDDVDQDLVRKFLFACRSEYQKTEDPKIAEMYSEVRAFINPRNYYVTTDRIMRLISKYSNVSDAILMIKDWYEPVKVKSKEMLVCPVCGKLLSNGLLNENRCTEMCMYYRDKASVVPKETLLDERLKYKSLKRGIYTFTLIPGISELRMYDQLVAKYAEHQVKLYPEIDKFDISVESNEGRVLIDVKDFASPYDLVETLVKNQSFIKMDSTDLNDTIILVIPEHRKFLYHAGDYKSIVKRKIAKASSKVLVLYENELYKKVGEIFDEY